MLKHHSSHCAQEPPCETFTYNYILQCRVIGNYCLVWGRQKAAPIQAQTKPTAKRTLHGMLERRNKRTWCGLTFTKDLPSRSGSVEVLNSCMVVTRRYISTKLVEFCSCSEVFTSMYKCTVSTFSKMYENFFIPSYIPHAIFTAHQRSCGKVMFLIVSVCYRVHKGDPCTGSWLCPLPSAQG